MTYTPTDEQHAIIDACTTGQNVVIEAGAGTGKTSTLRMAAADMPGRGLYVAYNRAIANEAAASFPASVTCKTAHSLAFGAVGRIYRHKLNTPRQPGQEAARILGVTHGLDLGGDTFLRVGQVGSAVMHAVDRFCQTADAEIQPWHTRRLTGLSDLQYDALKSTVTPLARRAWDDLTSMNGRLKFQHDHYLKLWALSGPQLGADYVLFDEAQDANPVIEGIVKGQRGSQLIAVGDSCQQLYGWRGAEDALSRWPADVRLYLSQSWRFGQGVADEANKWLRLLDTPLRIVGAPGQTSTVGELASSDAVLCRTNAGAVAEVMTALGQDRTVALVGGAQQIIGLARAADELRSGRGTTHPELCVFQTWAQVQEFADHDPAGSDLKAFVDLVDEHGSDVIIDALSRVDDDKPGRRVDLVCSTAHKAKGREWPTVKVGGDFTKPKGLDGDSDFEVDRPLAMLAYVSVTRARQQLDRGSLAWVDELAAPSAVRAVV